MMPGVKYVIYIYIYIYLYIYLYICICIYLHEYHYRSLTLEEIIVAVITQDRVMDDNLKSQIKNKTLCTCKLFPLT